MVGRKAGQAINQKLEISLNIGEITVKIGSDAETQNRAADWIRNVHKYEFRNVSQKMAPYRLSFFH